MVKNSTVVHYLADKKHNIQHRNVYDTIKHVKLNYSSEYEGILLYIGIDNIQDNNKIRYLGTTDFLDLFDRLDMMDIDVSLSPTNVV
jgi:hypothetical protein